MGWLRCGVEEMTYLIIGVVGTLILLICGLVLVTVPWNKETEIFNNGVGWVFIAFGIFGIVCTYLIG